MLIKILLGLALIGIIGFIVKARAISKMTYRDVRAYVIMYIFFACAIVSFAGLFYFA